MRKKKKQYSTRDFFLNIWETVEVRVKLYQLSDQQQNLRPNDPTSTQATNTKSTIKRGTPVAYDIGKLLHPIRLLEAFTPRHRLEYRILVKESRIGIAPRYLSNTRFSCKLPLERVEIITIYTFDLVLVLSPQLFKNIFFNLASKYSHSRVFMFPRFPYKK